MPYSVVRTVQMKLKMNKISFFRDLGGIQLKLLNLLIWNHYLMIINCKKIKLLLHL